MRYAARQLAPLARLREMGLGERACRQLPTVSYSYEMLNKFRGEASKSFLVSMKLQHPCGLSGNMVVKPLQCWSLRFRLSSESPAASTAAHH